MKASERGRIGAIAVASLFALGACSGMQGMMGGGMGGQSVTLSGSNEVPPVQTSASGSGTVKVGGDGSVDVRLTVTGMSATAAHIHQGAAGANGPVIVPLSKSGDNVFISAPGAKMTPEQLAAYKAGNTYLNVHSASSPGGEIRTQLKGM